MYLLDGRRSADNTVGQRRAKCDQPLSTSQNVRRKDIIYGVRQSGGASLT